MTTATVSITPGIYTLDPVHSSAGFSVKHMVSRFRGSFADVDAQLTIADDGAISLTGTVGVASVEVREPMLAGHLQSPDFFDAERHPRIEFRSSAVRSDGDELVVDGELTIKGYTRPVEARGTISHVEADMGGGARVGIDLETVLDRTAYGIDWNAPLPKGGQALANDVKLTVELEFTAEA